MKNMKKWENSTANLTKSCRRYIADILPKRSQTLFNWSIDQSSFEVRDNYFSNSL